MKQYDHIEIIRMTGLITHSVSNRIANNERNRFADVGKIMSDGIKSVLDYSPNTTIDDFVKKVKRSLLHQLNPIVIDRDNPKLNYIFKKIDDWANGQEPTVTTLYEYMLIDDERKPILLDILRSLIDGKKGKDVALTFLVCEHYHIMTRPPHKILSSIFSDIGSKQGYNDYYKKGLSYFRPDEINRIKKHLSVFLIVDN